MIFIKWYSNLSASYNSGSPQLWTIKPYEAVHIMSNNMLGVTAMSNNMLGMTAMSNNMFGMTVLSNNMLDITALPWHASYRFYNE